MNAIRVLPALDRLRRSTGSPTGARLLLRIALGGSFLSAVAGRVGLWGPHRGYAAEAFAGFREYVGELNHWLPTSALPVVAIVVTVLEADGRRTPE
jgi:hypothetical protein